MRLLCSCIVVSGSVRSYVRACVSFFFCSLCRRGGLDKRKRGGGERGLGTGRKGRRRRTKEVRFFFYFVSGPRYQEP